jgi:hypothetical protein
MRYLDETPEYQRLLTYETLHETNLELSMALKWLAKVHTAYFEGLNDPNSTDVEMYLAKHDYIQAHRSVQELSEQVQKSLESL